METIKKMFIKITNDMEDDENLKIENFMQEAQALKENKYFL